MIQDSRPDISWPCRDTSAKSSLKHYNRRLSDDKKDNASRALSIKAGSADQQHQLALPAAAPVAVQNRREVALPFGPSSVLSQQSNVMQSGLLTNSSFHNCNFTFNGKQWIHRILRACSTRSRPRCTISITLLHTWSSTSARKYSSMLLNCKCVCYNYFLKLYC